MAKKTVLKDVKQIKKELLSFTDKQEFLSHTSYFIFGFLCVILYVLLQIHVSAGGFLFLGIIALSLVISLLRNVRRIIKYSQQIQALKNQMVDSQIRTQKCHK